MNESKTVNLTLEENMLYDYAFFMMFTSYYKSAVCTSPEMEAWLFENYQKYGYDRQYQVEDLVIPEIENELLQRKEFEGIEDMDLELEINSGEDSDSCDFVAYFNNKKFDIKVLHEINPKTNLPEVSFKVKKMRIR